MRVGVRSEPPWRQRQQDRRAHAFSSKRSPCCRQLQRICPPPALSLNLGCHNKDACSTGMSPHLGRMTSTWCPTSCTARPSAVTTSPRPPTCAGVGGDGNAQLQGGVGRGELSLAIALYNLCCRMCCRTAPACCWC